MASMVGNLVCSSVPRGALVSPGVVQNSALGWPCFGRSSGATYRLWRHDGVRPLSVVRAPCSSSNSIIKKYWRQRVRAAEAAQAEAAEDEEEKEETSDNEGSEDGASSVSTLELLLEELKVAIAAKDEKNVAKLEAQLGAMENERDALGKQVLKLIEEVQTGKERLLRLSADFDNYRKRSENEKASLASSVRGDVIESLLPMVDNFERAKSSIRTESEGEEKIDRSYQGIYKQFVEIMKGLGVNAVETVGKAFDPNLHEAIMREESTEHEEGIVSQEFRRGFSIGSKLVRPAMVKVSTGPGANKAEPVPGEGVQEEAFQKQTSVETE